MSNVDGGELMLPVEILKQSHDHLTCAVIEIAGRLIR
jgi:hypothetical protein